MGKKPEAIRMNRPIKFRVLDGTDNTKNPVDVVVSTGPSGLTVAVQGHGLCESDDDCTEIIYLDYFEGKLTLLVWSDINSPDPTHRIPLAGAQLDKRIPSPTQVAEKVTVDRKGKQTNRGERQKRKPQDPGPGNGNAPPRGLIRRRPGRGTQGSSGG